MRRIVDKVVTVATCNRYETLRIARCTEEVRRHNHAGVSEPELCIIVIEVKRTPVAVRKSRDQPVPSHRVRGRREGEAREQHCAAERCDDPNCEHEPRGT